LCGLDFTIGDMHPPALAKKIERPLDSDHRLVVGTRRLLTSLERGHRVRPQGGLQPDATGDIDVRAGGTQRRLVLERSSDRVRERQTIGFVNAVLGHGGPDVE
jgi:hypothetical protein